MDRSGQAIPAGCRPPQAMSPESVQGIILQTTSHLQDIERVLTSVLDRLQPSNNNKTGGEAVTVPNGILNAANLMRNQAFRLVDMTNVLDNLI